MQAYKIRTLTIARHPSETDERMMVRLLSFALHANVELGPAILKARPPLC